MVHKFKPQELVTELGELQQEQQPASSPNHCIHCGTVIPSHWAHTEFCCAGCQFVYGLIHQEGLEKYYKLRLAKLRPLVDLFTSKRDLSWLDQALALDKDELELQIEGIQCTACVWMIKELAKRAELPVKLNTFGGKIILHDVRRRQAAWKDFVLSLQSFGYGVAPIEGGLVSSGLERQLLVRLGLSAALAMNAMTLVFASYLGLNQSEMLIFTLFSQLSVVFATLSFVVGGWYFIKRAALALARGAMHFDVPIAFGICATYFGSLYAFFSGHGEVYFDTLTIFIALMLLGRFVQARWVAKNQQQVLSPLKFEYLRVKRLSQQHLQEVPFSQLKLGDTMMLSMGGVVPVAAKLLGEKKAAFNLQWISGESGMVMLSPQETIPAGARYVGQEAINLKALQDFSQSRLSQVILSKVFSEDDPLWAKYSRIYTLFVLTLVSCGFLLWLPKSLSQAIMVAVTISVVTCPCGIGLAIPLVRALAHRRLVSLGVFLRKENVLEHLGKITQVVFDKTGTLSFSDLVLLNPQVIESLSKLQQGILFSATASSQHPVSRSVFQHLLGKKDLDYCAVEVIEQPGYGLRLKHEGVHYFLGRGQGSWQGQTIFSQEGQVLCGLHLSEEALADSPRVLSKLKYHYGKRLILLSGDERSKVERMTKVLGEPFDVALFELQAKDKGKWLSEHGAMQSMYLGDGLNDAEALKTAALSGVAMSQSFSMASSSDFYFFPQSLAWLEQMFALSKRQLWAIRGNLAFALVYNLLVAGFSMAGKINPLAAAIIMPLVSVGVVSVSAVTIKRL